MKPDQKPVANPRVVLREEFDDWAVIFDPDTGRGFGLNPIAVHLWKILDGDHSLNDLIASLRRAVPDLDDKAGTDIASFLEELADNGLVETTEVIAHVGRELSKREPYVSECVGNRASTTHQDRACALVYEPPQLAPFGHKTYAHGNCTPGSHDLGGACKTGNAAGCGSGGSVGYACSNGTAAGFPPTCNVGNLRSPYGFGCGCATGGADFIPDCSTGTGPM